MKEYTGVGVVKLGFVEGNDHYWQEVKSTAPECFVVRRSKIKNIKLKHYLRHHNKVNEYNALSYCDAWRYM